ncbi:MAG: DUF2922 domain-containing protein [Filifactoraceae bacterium]
MVETNYIVLEFVKTNGDKHSLKLAYPKIPVVSADVKALADFIVGNNVFSFVDGVTLKTFEGATIQKITESEINFVG